MALEKHARTRRWGALTSNAARVLIDRRLPILQVPFAAELGTSQARVSQIAALLAERGVTIGRLHEPAQRRRLAELYVEHHRPEIAAERFWFDIDRPLDQVQRAADHFAKRGRMTVSADAASDYVAPWRSPTLTVIYTSAEPDLSSAGFVPALGRGDASIIVRQVTDETLLFPWKSRLKRTAPFPLAHPLQQIWDLRDLGGADRDEAAERLVSYLVLHPVD